MNIRAELQIGNKHMTTKGEIEIVDNFISEGIIYTTYLLNGERITKKHSDVYKNIYYYIRKTNGQLPTRQRGMSSTRRTVQAAVNEIEYNRQLKFGIELEMLVPDKHELARKLESAGIPIQLPGGHGTHRVLENSWKIVYDGSIERSSGTYGWDGVELVSPPSGNFEQLKIVCEVLKEVGAKANASCGFHVHHDISELKRKQIIRIYNFYNKYETYIDMIHKASRANNRFAKPVGNIIDRVNRCSTKSELLSEVAGQGRGGYYNNIRYYKINLRSFLYYGTIEFRQHAGTVSYEEITNWINFTHKIVERGLEIENDIVYPEYDERRQWSENNKLAFESMFKELHVENTTLSKYIEKKTKRKMNRAA